MNEDGFRVWRPPKFVQLSVYDTPEESPQPKFPKDPREIPSYIRTLQEEAEARESKQRELLKL